MTETELDLESQAQLLAARGREVLVERTRTAYSDAAAAQADLITLDDEHIEAMVQAAADRADGLQWRRALATVATRELGISASEALSHPAVTRAQTLVGAPSYEQSLAEMIARPVPPAAPTPVAAATEPSVAPAEPFTAPTETFTASAEQYPGPAEGVAEPFQQLQYGEEPSDELETVEADDVVLELLPEPDPVEYEYESEYEPESTGYRVLRPIEPEPTADQADPYADQPEPHPVEPQTQSSEPQTRSSEPEPAPVEPAPRPIDDRTQAYDVEASFTDEPLPPPPTNPFAAQAEPEFEAGPGTEGPGAHTVPSTSEPSPSQDLYPPTEQHQSAGVVAAIAAVSTPGSQPDPIVPEPHAVAQLSMTEPEPEPEPEPEDESVEVSFPAIHLGGVAGLPTKKEGLGVRLSAEGLDIMSGPREIVGRLVWDEIEALEVPNLRVRRRQKTARARLVVRTPHGDASFEVPDITVDELRDRVEPLMRLYGRH